MNVGALNECILPCPSLELQAQFRERVTKRDDLEGRHRASLARLDALFASLQHRAFRGSCSSMTYCQTMTRRAIALIILVGELRGGTAEAAVQPKRLFQKAGPIHWSGPQFIQADAEGNVFLLRGDDLTVYPITRDQQLGTPSRLAIAADGAPLRDAVMNGRREWLVLLGMGIQRATADEVVSAPVLKWMPLGVGFVDGNPVAVVSAMRMGRKDDEDPEPPFLARSSGDEWVAEMMDPATSHAGDPNAAISDRAAYVLSDRGGRYFVAREYVYRVESRKRTVASALAEVRIGPSQMKSRATKPGEGAALAATHKPAEGARVGVFQGVPAVRALARGDKENCSY